MNQDIIDIASEDQVKEFIAESVEAAEKDTYYRKLLAERNERWAAGHQQFDLDVKRDDNSHNYFDNHPMVVENHLRNIILTFTARITNELPSVTAYPTHKEAKDRGAATIAQKLIEHISTEVDYNDKLAKVARRGGEHGVAGIKFYYDQEKDRIEWDVVCLFDILVDPDAPSFTEAKWVIFRKYISEPEARLLVPEGSVLSTEQYYSSATDYDKEKNEGVPVLEMWALPSAQFPKGAYVLSVGDNITDAREYPYVFKETENDKPEYILPLALFNADSDRGHWYGGTWMDDCLPIQRLYNENLTTLKRLNSEIAGLKLVMPTIAADSWQGSKSQIIKSDEPSSVPIYYINPPTVPPTLINERERLKQTIYQVAGQSEQLTTGTSNASDPAKKIAYQNELSKLKHSETMRSFENMLLHAWKGTLRLVQKYYLGDRVLRITNEDGVDFASFRASDIQGTDVRIESASRTTHLRAFKEQQALEMANKRMISPQAAQAAQGTGLMESQQDSLDEQLAKEEIATVLQGGEIEPNSRPNIILPVIDTVLEVLLKESGSNTEEFFRIQNLKQAYLQKLQQQRQAQQGKPQGVK